MVRRIVIGALCALLMTGMGISAFAASPTSAPAHPKTLCKETKKHACEKNGAQKAYLAAEAKALNLTPKELAQALKSGKSISDLATGKKFTQATFAKAVKANIKPSLDKLVATHKLSAKQEAKILSALEKGHVSNWKHHSKHSHKP